MRRSRAEVEAEVIRLVTDLQGCKITELVARPELSHDLVTGHDLPTIIFDLISEHRLVEVEYSTPVQPGRLKSFLLPAGSEVTRAP